MKFTPRKLILVTSLMVMASSLMATDSLATTAPQSQPQITSCPTEFFVVKIHEDARQCQPFDTEMPASMVYFIGDTPDAIVAYYLALMPDLSLKLFITPPSSPRSSCTSGLLSPHPLDCYLRQGDRAFKGPY